MLSTQTLVETLGGRAALKQRVANLRELEQVSQSGLPFGVLETVMARFHLTRAEVESLLQVPPRTLARRKSNHRLRADESDRLIRFARLATQATQVLGSEEKSAAWLHRPNRALRNQAPLDLLRTDLGAKQVEEVLGRIEHGTVS